MSLVFDLTNAYYLVYYQLLKTQYESKYVMSINDYLHESIENMSRFAEIQNIKKLLFHLESVKLLFAHKATLYSYIKSVLIIKIIECCKYHRQAVKILKNKKSIIEKIYEIAYLFDSQLKYINSYEMMPSIFGNDLDINDSATQMVEKPRYNIKQKWIDQTKEEAMNRLVTLTKYFGANCLNHYDVKVLTYCDVYDMKFTSIVRYYNKTIKKIKQELIKCHMYCDAYIEIEKTYTMMLVTSDHTTPLDNYDLVLDID